MSDIFLYHKKFGCKRKQSLGRPSTHFALVIFCSPDPTTKSKFLQLLFFVIILSEKNRESSGFEVSELVVGPGEQNINRAIFDIELTISQSGHRNMQVKSRTSISFPLHSRTIVRLYN